MGGFFVRYFLSKGARVAGADARSRTRTRSARFSFARTNAEAVAGAEVVLVATPMEKTVETVEEVAGSLAPGACVVEITSVKGRTLGALSRLAEAGGFRLLSTHPLFGPSLRSYGGMRICVVETERGSMARARALFPDAALIPMKREDHDRAMGIVLSLTHLLNIAYAGVVARYMSPGEFRKVQTPTSAVQLTVAEGVLSQSPALYSLIQTENEHSSEFAGALIDELTSLRGLIASGDREGFGRRFTEIAEGYSGDSQAALDLVYQAFEKTSG
jgi:prephenate dehydrogenase